MSKFPQTVGEMEERGYKHLNDGSCTYCSDPISWWETPNAKKIPMNAGTATAHFTTCPNADEARSRAGGESITVTRLQTGNCDLCGEPAVVRVKIGRGSNKLCASHANQLFVKLKHSGKQG
jgi:hypothetical protein